MAGPVLDADGNGMTRQGLEFAINHVFLPPKTPQSDDTSATGEMFLIRSFLSSLQEFSTLEPGDATRLQPLVRMVERLLRLQVHESKETITTEILGALNDGESAVFYIREQNAGLLLTGKASTILAQGFELLSDNGSVMSSKGCLIRQFPDVAAEFPRALLQDRKLTEEFVDVLCKLTRLPITAVRPKTRKAKADHDENRDTVSPILVTSMFLGVLHGLGQVVKPTTITKRMREQVNWDNTKQPFHRSPLWVLLRVAIRMVLAQDSGHNDANCLYKAVSTFYHASLLGQATEIALSSDIRFTMSAKLLRRIINLNPSENLAWVQKAQEILNFNHDGLKSRWLAVQQEEGRSVAPSPLANLCFYDDTNLQLKQLNRHLAWIRSRPSANVVDAGPGDDTTMPETSVAEFPSLSSDPGMRPFVLLNFEAWIDQHLPSWVASQLENNNKQSDKAALSLGKLESNIIEYLCLAQDLYTNDPEALSMMYLVTMELWVALDRIASDAIPLLLQYNPGFPYALLQPLILPTARQMERLHSIENYLVTRRTGNYLMMFSNFGKASSFAVRYFDESLPGGHRDLHDRIVSAAERSKRQKLEEYRTKRHEYSTLVSQRSLMNHDQEWNEYRRIWECIWGCKACALDVKIKDITIKKFEWPLPTDANQAKAVAFEIDVPSLVRVWRNTTVQIFLGVLVNRERWGGRKSLELYYPTDHSGLRAFQRSTSSIQLASQVKSVERSHYGSDEHISMLSESDVCVEHGCRYDYYHRQKAVGWTEIFEKPSIDSGCSHAAHEQNSYLSNLIRQSSHQSNYVISSQEGCPSDMSLEEYRAFGHHRAGDSLQWANTLSQLTMPSVDFNRQSTFFLIMQACTEAGARDKLGSVYRKSHSDPADETFAAGFLGALEDAFVRVHKNWQNDIALGLLTCLAARILSLTNSCYVSQGVLKLLARIRTTSIDWARELLSKRASSPSDNERQALAHRALMAAFICMSTFDMESDRLEQLLSSSEALSHFVEAAIVACDHLPTTISDPAFRFMACRWRSVMYRSMGILREEVTGSQNSGLGFGIQHFWADYMPSQSGWSSHRGPRNHILESSVSRTGQTTSVTWNMLTGQLLVNGYPLSRLPRNFELDPSYSQLFGARVLEVMPSTFGGMHFSACRDQEGWIVHFSMVDDRVVTQAVRVGASTANGATDDEELWEFVPRSCFAGDLPRSFIMGFSHWRNKRTGNIEFRPATQPWYHSPNHWTLLTEGHRRVLKQGGKSVVDLHSMTANTLSARLKAMESKENLDIIFDHDADYSRLEINLPRFALSFSLVSGESHLRSKHYAGMILDECQDIGSLIGLQNKLVLRDEHCADNLSPSRLVLVPRGQTNVSLKGHHVHVESQTMNVPHVKHDAFQVDTRLGRLTDNGSLTSKLFLCLLHALTSHCLLDPLTSRTGTDEALRILRQASVRSFQRLDMSSISILREISNLSPKRVFYPEHLENMEQCVWNHNLPVLSQHDGFRAAVEEIITHAQNCEVLYKSTEGGAGKEIGNLAKDVKSHLLVERAIIRNSIFRVAEFGAEDYSSRHDVSYCGRHNVDSEFKRSSRAQKIASLVYSGTPQLLFPTTAKLKLKILSTTGSGFPGNPRVDLRFSSGYFDKPGASLQGIWCGLHRALATEENSYRIIFFLASLAFAAEADLDLVQALLAISTNRAMFGALVKPPDEESFDLAYDRFSLGQRVVKIAHDKRFPEKKCPSIPLTRRPGESDRNFEVRLHREWDSQSGAMVKALVSSMESQWSNSWTISWSPGQPCERWVDVGAVIPAVNKTLDLTRRTILFNEYLDSFVLAIAGMTCLASSEDALMALLPRPDARQVVHPLASQIGFITDSSLFSNPAPETHRPVPERFLDLLEETPQADVGQMPITHLIEHLSDLGKKQQHQLSYIGELRQSSESVGTAQLIFKADNQTSFSRLSDYLIKCQRETARMENDIVMALRGNGVAEKLCIDCEFYPRVSPIFLLQHLRRDKWNRLPTTWRVPLLNYALSLAYLQRAERLVNSYGFDNRRVDFLKELRNSGHHDNEDCDPLDWPEYLLLEVEQGILIRPVQHQIAANMRKPPGGKSSVMQLNMGEGKSSVIVPIVSTAISDGSCLARVFVAKAQAKQMEHLLVSVIGGLLNRPTFYLPISRAVRFDDSAISIVARMIQQCKKEGGVLLVQPEHILSFKLLGLEGIWNRVPIASKILRTYEELESISRDIVDESDENFSVKFELIYTMGSQQPVDMSPDRWVFIQDLMDMVRDVARELKHGHGGSSVLTEGLLFEEDSTASRFPTIRTLDESTGTQLVEAIARKLCSLGMRGLPVQHQTTQMRDAVLKYILDPRVDQQHIEMVENDQLGLFQDNIMRKGLFLLRGLLAGGVLQFALGQKRFRVNYGLAPDRQPPTMLAVPYRAKDSPAPRSEFSHTDAVIILTCLSYYYRGLTDQELFISLEMLSNSDRAEQEYSSWSRASPLLDPTLRHFSAVNLKDKTLCTEKLFPGLRFTKPAVDYYLSNVVFPKEMREFPFKLSSSGWDLAKPKTYPLTGFSGTTDSKNVLPNPITALDLPEQRHTNSYVLACLLQSENTVMELGSDQEDLCALTVNTLLPAVTNSDQSMRVILDVGAQIIELSNLQFSRYWLSLVSDADAVIFFNDNDELSVVMRNGTVESFYTSPFKTQTERCLVFLDQAHTRGTDLRLPDSYRAAVTLGPGVTKDTLVQACMRMRKLGSGQSVTFCLSPEMQKRIRDFERMDTSHPITVMHVLTFAISETWDDAHRSVPLWATQGLRHQRQEQILGRVSGYGNLEVEDVEEYLEDEAQTLEMRYRPASAGGQSQSLSSQFEAASTLVSRQTDVAAIRQKCIEFGFSNLDSVVTLEEEQERELAPEIEQERHVERPAPMKPLKHSLHPDVLHFVMTGTLKPESNALLPAFQAMTQSSASKVFPANQFPSSLLITKDFAETVQPTRTGYCSDSYQRPVQWILTPRIPEDKQTNSGSTMQMIIISPYEADIIKSDILRCSKGKVILHSYLPRSSLSFRTMEDLKTFTYPPLTPKQLEEWTAPAELIMQLNLFAGQLYLRSYEEYVRMCRYLGLSYTENKSDGSDGVVVGADGFVGRAGGEGYENCPFEKSPVGFLSVLYKRLRRDCTNIDRTHMGMVLAGGILTEKDFRRSWR
ncbi:hypothetical protein B0T21DRAFT_454868 [Apiosordaria backusii]|uniref:ubiquitinyl hydrolase 1 n=1 Tax=Apiosordaria backusii TaxID=314023 RepID=A0AA40A6Y5_9PEZI|nr:hypothetical protein B0T21DRAFT_454868 [Apiosordaria backusii]